MKRKYRKRWLVQHIERWGRQRKLAYTGTLHGRIHHVQVSDELLAIAFADGTTAPYRMNALGKP